MPENKVIISCDSTADLSEALVERFGVRVNHLPVIMNGVPYIDGVTVKPADLFEFYKSTGTPPPKPPPIIFRIIWIFLPRLSTRGTA